MWRRRLRQFARAADLRISVTRSRDYMIVENVDFESSDDDNRATADVIGAVTGGPCPSTKRCVPCADSGCGSYGPPTSKGLVARSHTIYGGAEGGEWNGALRN